MLKEERKWNHKILNKNQRRQQNSGRQKETKNKGKQQMTVTNMVDINPTMLVTTLNTNVDTWHVGGSVG